MFALVLNGAFCGFNHAFKIASQACIPQNSTRRLASMSVLLLVRSYQAGRFYSLDERSVKSPFGERYQQFTFDS